MKQAILARRDLGMGEGKLAAQVAHASLLAYERASESARTAWKQDGQTKVVLRVESETELFAIKEEAEAAGLPTGLVRDAGRTQLEPNTVTTLAIGPAAADAVDAVTGDLSLY